MGKGNKFDANGKITRAEAATMMVSFKEIDADKYNFPSKEFTDLGENWYVKYINAAYENGLVQGKGEGKFDPEGKLTRAEAVAMIVSAMGYEILENQEASFTDIDGEWYTNYINTAYAHGIVAGKQEGKFAPVSEVTRAEMVTMLYATLKENYGEKEIYSVSIDANQNSFILKDGAGNDLSYKKETEEFSGNMAKKIKDRGAIWYLPMEKTSSLVFEAIDGQVMNFDVNRYYGNINFEAKKVNKIQIEDNKTVTINSDLNNCIIKGKDTLGSAKIKTDFTYRFSDNYQDAESKYGNDFAIIEVGLTTDFTITNKEGKKLIWNKGNVSSDSDMETLECFFNYNGSIQGVGSIVIYVKNSDNFTFTPVSENKNDVDFCLVNETSSISIIASNIESIEISR